MLLFDSDWGLYPGAIIHYRTRNQTFLRMAEVYKKMGVKNYAFHLILLNPELEYVDPHDPNLDAATMAKIGIECLYNPWYFFREVLRVPPQSSREPLQFRANRGNLALIWLFFNHIDVALIQPRQTGKSLSTDAIMLYLLVVGAKNSRINLLTLSNQLRVANVARLKKMRLYLPYYMQAPNPKDADNTVEVTCLTNDNVYSTAVSQASEAGAITVGRGLTAPIAQVDEGPYIDHIDVALSAMLAAGTAARDEAKLYGMPYGTIFTTTAGKKDTKSGKYMYTMIHGGAPWSERFLDCENVDEVRLLVEKNSPGEKKMVNATFSHRQLGYTDEWLRRTMADNNSYGDSANRDFLNVWTSGGATSPLTVELLERIRNSQMEPRYTEITNDGYILRWYIEEHEIVQRMSANKIIMGLDTSEAIGKDAISMVFVDCVTLEIIAAANINETNIIRFTNWVTKLMKDYANLIMVPERRSTGGTIIDNLLISLPPVGIDPFRRIYNIIVDESNVRQEEYRELFFDIARRPPRYYDQHKKDFGFVTSGSGRHSRNQLYGEAFTRGASLACDKCYDKTLIDQITSLETKSGRIDHGEAGHDDAVVAWLLTIWFLTSTKNLQFYGITNALEKTREFRPGFNHEVVYDPYVEMENEAQRGIKQEIEDLLEEIKECRDEFIVLKFEARIRALNGRLNDSFNEAVSIDALISEARAMRSKTVKERMLSRAGAQKMTTYARRRMAEQQDEIIF